MRMYSNNATIRNSSESHLNASQFSFVEGCDGIISITSKVYEPEATRALGAWLCSTNRRFYILGPILEPGFEKSSVAIPNPVQSLTGGTAICRSFLDNALEKFGKHSVIYVRPIF